LSVYILMSFDFPFVRKKYWYIQCNQQHADNRANNQHVK
jgi:hypothetical protein